MATRQFFQTDDKNTPNLRITGSLWQEHLRSPMDSPPKGPVIQGALPCHDTVIIDKILYEPDFVLSNIWCEMPWIFTSVRTYYHDITALTLYQFRIIINRGLSIGIFVRHSKMKIETLQQLYFNTLINSSPPSVAYKRQWIGSALVQIMACRLFGANPLSKSMLGYCRLNP